VNSSRLHLLWRDRSPVERFRTAVSLHSHTLFSRESLAFIPRYTAGVPFVGAAIRQQEERYLSRCGKPLDFGSAFWRPPLAPHQALELERTQISEKLGLDPLVSITDHDDVQAGMLLSVIDQQSPVSVEWTVPFGPTFFHLGLHNLPQRDAQATMAQLAAVTRNPTREGIQEVLRALNESPSTLVVWNHPAWDEARIGSVEHAQVLGKFLERYGEHLHALELNGLRPWSENKRVVRIAEQSGHPVVSGGDRHGLEPNANLNLTNASCFAEFVDEVRRDRHSDVLFMPQYREPIRMRMIETMRDIMRDYPEFPEDRRRWSDRVFYTDRDGVVRPLSAVWNGNEPWPVKWFVRGIRATTMPQIRTALKAALADAQEIA
jgi:hypothetical protein